MRRTLALLCAIAPAFALPRRGALAPREPGLLGPILGGLGLGGGGGTCGYTCPPGDLTKGLLIGVTSKAGLLECTYLDLFNENLLCLYSSTTGQLAIEFATCPANAVSTCAPPPVTTTTTTTSTSTSASTSTSTTSSTTTVTSSSTTTTPSSTSSSTTSTSPTSTSTSTTTTTTSSTTSSPSTTPTPTSTSTSSSTTSSSASSTPTTTTSSTVTSSSPTTSSSSSTTTSSSSSTSTTPTSTSTSSSSTDTPTSSSTTTTTSSSTSMSTTSTSPTSTSTTTTTSSTTSSSSSSSATDTPTSTSTSSSSSSSTTATSTTATSTSMSTTTTSTTSTSTSPSSTSTTSSSTSTIPSSTSTTLSSTSTSSSSSTTSTSITPTPTSTSTTTTTTTTTTTSSTTTSSPPTATPTWTFDGTGHYNLTLPNNRWALVHVSRYFNYTVSHPLIIAFHGAGSTAQTQEAISGMSAGNGLVIDSRDVVVVYGQSTMGTKGANAWNGAPYSAAGIDDVGYTQDILNAVKSALPIDNTRIYAVGFSNGGGFVNELACTPSISGTFAAFATSSAALYAGTHSMSGCDTGGHVVALLDFHGLNDGQIPYHGRTDLGGDTGYALPDTDAWRQGWAQRAGCAPPPANQTFAPTTVTYNYLNQNATGYEWDCPQATIMGYTVQTMAHFWLSAAGGYWDETTVNIVPFFEARPLGSPRGV